MSFSSSMKAKLKAEAHRLEPVIQVGKNGVTDRTISNINKVLKDHELIKIRFISHKEEKEALIGEITNKTGANLVDLIGNTAILFKTSEGLSS